MSTHSSILAWEITWTEEPGGLQSMRSQSDATKATAHTSICIIFYFNCCFFPYFFLPCYGSCKLSDSPCPSYDFPQSCFGYTLGVSVDLPVSCYLLSLPCGPDNGHIRSFPAFLNGRQGKARLELSELSVFFLSPACWCACFMLCLQAQHLIMSHLPASSFHLVSNLGFPRRYCFKKPQHLHFLCSLPSKKKYPDALIFSQS